MREPGLVSVVIPIYNASRFLKQTVESVLGQSYTQWELLLVDDGSSDGSAAIAQGYSGSHVEKVRYLEHAEHANLGVCSTRNLGIAQSRGEFVAVLDADDLWLPNKLAEQIEIMRANPAAGLLYGHSIYFDEEVPGWETNPELAAGERLYQPPELLRRTYPLGSAGAPCPSSFLLRHEALEKVGGFEEGFNRIQAYEDQVFLAKIYLNVPVFVSSRTWDRYRMHGASCTSNVKAANAEPTQRWAYLDWLEGYLRERRITDMEIWRGIERLRWPYRHPVLAFGLRIAKSLKRRLLRVKA